MKVFKFGGASIRSAQGVKNLAEIVSGQDSQQPIIVVVSAMGKTTNALEDILKCRLSDKDCSKKISELKENHLTIITDLFEDPTDCISKFEDQFESLGKAVENANPHLPEWSYDQLISMGEELSSLIIVEYLLSIRRPATLMKAVELIKTSSDFREAAVKWSKTEELVNNYVINHDFKKSGVLITQGFIGSDEDGNRTTLGREGSDFTAAILARCINAEDVTIWKDVPGIMNADPKIIPEAILFDELSYNEASEMTYYGASVIHPKTIRPLANRMIPLYVKPFKNYTEKGTIIHDCKPKHHIPAIIFKNNQCLFTFQFSDFSFVNERSLSIIYDNLDKLNIKINMMQNSAISFSVCVDYNARKMQKLIEALEPHLNLKFQNGLQLITIKNYTDEALKKYIPRSGLVLEQKTMETYQAVVMR